MRAFSNSEIVWSISLDQFPFRFQPIFVVVTKLSAMRAVDLVRAIQNFFDLPSLADYIAARNNPSYDSSGDRFFTGDEKRLGLDGIPLPAAPLQNAFCIFNHRRMATEISDCVFPSKAPEVRVFAD